MSDIKLPLMDDVPDQVGVLVLGGGLAGSAALLAAAEAGRYAVLMEKECDIGGSTVHSAGLTAFAGTDEQQAQGILDSSELLRKDLIETGLHVNDESLVDLYCNHQIETYRWLKSHGVRYGEVHAAAGQSAPRSHPANTTWMLNRLLARAGTMGARLLTNVAGRRVIRVDGQVTGVEVQVGDELRYIAADAVVLATGGFSRNSKLLKQFAPQMANALQAGGDGCQGDGMLMAWQLGAGVVDIPYIKGTYGIYPHPHPDEDGTGILAVYKGAIAVNSDGRRFVNESSPYKEMGDASLAQAGGTTYQIFDSQVMAQSNDEVPIYEFAGRLRSGMLAVSSSLTGLAESIGLPEGALERTVAAYNQTISDGSDDEFGRRHLSGAVGELLPLDQPPFYAHPTGTVVLATYGGLTVDTDLQVLDVFGQPIPGLFAAGEVIGGFHGGGYMTGTSIGKSGIFGRLAGISAARGETSLSW